MTALGSHTSTKRLSLRPPSLGAALLRTCSLSQAPPSLFFNSLPPRPGWEVGMMSTRNKKQVGNESFQAAFPTPTYQPTAAKLQALCILQQLGDRPLCPKGMGGNQRERAFQGGAAESGRSRGLRHGE